MFSAFFDFALFDRNNSRLRVNRVKLAVKVLCEALKSIKIERMYVKSMLEGTKFELMYIKSTLELGGGREEATKGSNCSFFVPNSTRGSYTLKSGLPFGASQVSELSSAKFQLGFGARAAFRS